MASVDIFRISDLESRTGLPRTTIYHYQRIGLVPPAKRGGGGPASYGTTHLEALETVRDLRGMGVSIAAIRARLNARPSGEETLDLSAEHRRVVQRRILDVAAHQFARKGYEATRLADILDEAGVSSNTFYGHFGGKRQLFVQVVENFIHRALPEGQDKILAEPDMVKRHLIRAARFLGLRNLSPDMLTFVRAEALDADDDTRRLLSRIHGELTRYILEDLQELRRLSPAPPRTEDEMLAFSLFGAKESAAMRLSWDERYSVEDYLWTNLELILSVRALYLGPADLPAERRRYAPFVAALAAAQTPSASR